MITGLLALMITHVAFRVSNLDASRDFYQKLGFEQAFTFEDAGRVTVAFMKINDHQFIELYPQTDKSQPIGLMHVCFETRDIEALRKQYEQRGLKPAPVNKARAGNLLFSIYDPENRQVEYLQYLPGSLHSNDRGRHLGLHRVSERLSRVIEAAQDPAAETAFYRTRLGIGNELRFGSKTQLVFEVATHPRTITDPDGITLIFQTKP